MRKVLVPFAALVLCAAPVAAQQAPEGAQVTDQVEVVKAAPAAQAQPVEEPKQAPRPTLAVSSEQVKEHVRAVEDERGEAQQMGSSFWYTVAAVAIGVIIALLLLD